MQVGQSVFSTKKGFIITNGSAWRHVVRSCIQCDSPGAKVSNKIMVFHDLPYCNEVSVVGQLYLNIYLYISQTDAAQMTVVVWFCCL